MKPLLVLSFAALPAICFPAGTVDTAIVAAMKLAEAPNYSWNSVISDDARTYDIDGKTLSGAYTWQRQPMPRTIARRLGRDAGRELEAIFLRPQEYVIRTSDGWKSPGELPKRHDDWHEEGDWYFVTLPTLPTPDMPADLGGMGDIHGFGLPPAIFIPVVRERDPHRAYSNAQFALALPHEELAVIVSSHDEFKVEEDTVSGSLTDLGAQLLLVHDGHEYITPVVADGRFKLLIDDGIVTRYTVELAGVVVVDKKPVYVQQKSTTFIKNIGTTDFAVPRDALQRLGR